MVRWPLECSHLDISQALGQFTLSLRIVDGQQSLLVASSVLLLSLVDRFVVIFVAVSVRGCV